MDCLTPATVKSGIRPYWCSKKEWNSAIDHEKRLDLLLSDKCSKCTKEKDKTKIHNPLEGFTRKQLKKELKRRKNNGTV